MSSSHLSRIETQWSIVRDAHGSTSKGHVAQNKLIEIYGFAIKRYLRALLRSEDAAEEVFQEFALRLVRGDFKNADSEKGRFRSMIKTALYRLMIDYFRKNKKEQKCKTGQDVEDIAMTMPELLNDNFTLTWRQSLLEMAWGRLQQLQEQTGKPYYTVLKLRVDQPTLTTSKLYKALQLESDALPKESAFRVFLHRARKRFAAILLDQVIESLNEPTDDEIELELIDLGLHHFCKPALGNK